LSIVYNRMLLEKFIIEKPNYYNHINFLVSYFDVKAFEKEFLQGVRTDTLIKALEDYIISRGVNTNSAAQTFSYAIQEYFNFLFSIGLQNNELEHELGRPASNDRSYRSRINTFISDHPQLMDSEGFNEFTYDQIKKLVYECDRTFEGEDSETALTTQIHFNKFRSALILKLIVMTGIRYEVIPTLKKTDLNLGHCRITINGFEFMLPKKVYDQFVFYERLLERMSIADRTALFIESNKKTISKVTSTTSNFLKKLTSRGDINGGVGKYAIIKLLEAGMPESAIKEITQAGPTVINECYAAARIGIQRHVNSSLTKAEMYDLL
jgi:integrase